jgi:hypothetical protein
MTASYRPSTSSVRFLSASLASQPSATVYLNAPMAEVDPCGAAKRLHIATRVDCKVAIIHGRQAFSRGYVRFRSAEQACSPASSAQERSLRLG